MFDDPQFRRPVRKPETEALHVGMAGIEALIRSGDLALAALQIGIYKVR